jgi:Tfp pilus assembly protein PilF
VRFYLEHPDEARRIGEAAAAWFDRCLNAARRRLLFEQIVTDGRDDPQFALPGPSRFVRSPFGGQGSRLVAALAVYETIQQLHADAETLAVQVDGSVPGDFAHLCSTLPRVKVRREFPAAGRPDLLVASVSRETAALESGVPRIWFWDAAPNRIPGICERFKAAGYIAPRDGLAFLQLSSAEAAQPVDRDLAKARERLLNCDPAGAFDLARRALQRDPASVDAHLVIAEIALENGKTDLCEKMLARAKDLAKSDPRVALQVLSATGSEARQSLVDRMLATSMRHLPDRALASGRAVAERATKLDPGHAAAWYWWGYLSFRLAGRQVGPARKTEQAAALDAMRRAVELAPHRADFCRELGMALRQTGKADEAAFAFERAAAADPLDPANWFWLGDALLKAEQFERAEALVEEGLKHVGADGRLARLLEDARTRRRPSVGSDPRAAGGDEVEMLGGPLSPIAGILNDAGVDTHVRSLRLAAAFDGIARQQARLVPGPTRRVLMAYQPWFGVDMIKLAVECLEQGQLLVLFAEERAGAGIFRDRIEPATFRRLEYRGVNLWTVCRYRAALILRKMTERIDPTTEEDRKVLAALYDHAATIVDKAIAHLDCYRPETVAFAQGHDLVSAVLRGLGIRRGLRVVSLENIFRKDRLLWEDVSGISVNQNLSRNYYWRYRDAVSTAVVDGSVATYLEQVKGAKSGEHASPSTRLPAGLAADLPTITYLAQVSADSSVLFGLRGFASQIEVIATLARFAAARGIRLLIKLHPKENPAFKESTAAVRGLTAEGLAHHAGFQEARERLGGRLILDDANRYDTYDMIRNANVCVTINSQAGLEAALHGKEVVLCGEAFYGALGFTHEATDAATLEFALDRILRDDVRVNRGSEVRSFFYIFAELYCLPKSVAAMRALLGGRPTFAAATTFAQAPVEPASRPLQPSSP